MIASNKLFPLPLLIFPLPTSHFPLSTSTLPTSHHFPLADHLPPHQPHYPSLLSTWASFIPWIRNLACGITPRLNSQPPSVHVHFYFHLHFHLHFYFHFKFQFQFQISISWCLDTRLHVKSILASGHCSTSSMKTQTDVILHHLWPPLAIFGHLWPWRVKETNEARPTHLVIGNTL